VLVSVLGGLICWKVLKQIYQATRRSKMTITKLEPLPAQSSVQLTPIEKGQIVGKAGSISMGTSPITKSDSSLKQHVHSEECGCGHQHVASADAVNSASTWREYVGIVATIGARPCTGAIMVLLFANMAGLYWMGVASAIAMAIGTACTTSLIALLTLTGKHFVKRYLLAGNSNSAGGWKLASSGIQLLGGLFLIAVGLILFMGKQDYGMSPVF
jgi:nickel/cobalt exporter